MNKFSLGDEVTVVTGCEYLADSGSNGVEWKIPSEKVRHGATPESGVNGIIVDFHNGIPIVKQHGREEQFGYKPNNLVLVKKGGVTIKNMNLIETYKLATKKEPEKTFIKAGVANMDGTLTKEGSELFMTYMLDKHGADFKKEVVDGIVAAQEEEK